MSNGWIRLHRQITDNWIWEDADKLKAWLDILLMVNHEEKKILVNGQLVTIQRGERLTSIKKLAERWGWTRHRVMRFLSLLEEDNMCTTNRTPYGTTLKVVNYAEYQGFLRAKRTGVDTTDGTPNGTPLDTTDGTPLDTQTITNNTSLNTSSKNDKTFFSAPAQKKLPPAKSDIEAYCREKKYKFDIGEFMTYYDMRGWELSNGKKMTDWKAAVDYWHRHDRKMANEGGSNMPCFELYEEKEVRGTAPKFDGGLVAEMKRKRKEKA